MNKIKFFVRTTGERDLSEFNKLSNVEFLYDREHKPVDSFIKQLNIISEYDSVLLEDDVILCEDFENKLYKVIEKYPNKIVNFFFRPNLYFSTHEIDEFIFNQCTYYPKGISNLISEEMIRVRQKTTVCRQYDVLESSALKNLGMTHIVYRPCLVQHKDISSLMHNGYGKWTVWFEDYINKLGITYEEAYSRKPDLVKLLEADIKKWTNKGE